MIKKLILLLTFALCLLDGFSQRAKIIAGPMLGYAEHRECLVWVQTTGTKKVTLVYNQVNSTIKKRVTIKNSNRNREPWIAKFVITGLEPGNTYNYKILINRKPANFGYPLSFKTKTLWEFRTDAPDFTFLFGSCTYVNDSAYDRPGKSYGQNTGIFTKMADVPADFMLWLGDNTYLREADYSSESGVRYRYMHTRADKNMQKLLATKNNYATWDDHDFGDNDAGKSFWLKDVTRDCFTNYWGNRTYGENGKGVYSSFKWSDADFFLVDDRTFRDESDLDETTFLTKTQLGKEQLEWFKNSLKHSRSPFKFVVMGGQFLNEHTTFESYNIYKRERDEILNFIKEQKIGGVIFLSGDRHHTELIKADQIGSIKMDYPLYDFTSSPLTAGTTNVRKSKEFENPKRVENTLVDENNFCSISISGKRNQRKLSLKCFDKNGQQKWEHVIEEGELKLTKQ